MPRKHHEWLGVALAAHLALRRDVQEWEQGEATPKVGKTAPALKLLRAEDKHSIMDQVCPAPA